MDMNNGLNDYTVEVILYSMLAALAWLRDGNTGERSEHIQDVGKGQSVSDL